MADHLRLQREFFGILYDFFTNATGERPEDFADLDKFGEAIHQKGKQLAPGATKAFGKVVEDLKRFYVGEDRLTTFQQAREVGGMKLVLGGTSRFTSSHLASVGKMALYVDTILIPDPILPWLEVDRSEEKFRHVKLLEAVFFLLRLKPLVDATLPYPAVMVFQSWEKSLETKDEVTKKGLANIILAFFSRFLSKPFADPSEILQYVRSSGAEFLDAVERNHLFIAPGGELGDPLAKAIPQYKNEIKTWRSAEMNQTLSGYSDAELVWLGICERVAPQYHLLENAEELGAQPMLCLLPHWHYYSLCSKMFEGRLVAGKLLSQEAISSLRALNEPSMEWLGNIPISALAELRERNENEEFRRRISTFTSALHDASLEDIDRITREVSRGIAALIADHRNKVRRIEEKYRPKYRKTAIAGWVTVAATFVPALAPFLAPLAPIGLAGMYLNDKLDERAEKKQTTKSLTGVLAAAQEEEQV